MPPYCRIELNGWRGLGHFDPDDIKEYRQHGAIIHEFEIPDCSPNGVTPVSFPETALIGAHPTQEVSHDQLIDNASAGADAGPNLTLDLDLPDARGPETV